jgi:DMSO reductase anchor subunit
MHPAYSVIVFTTASGMGYGLLILLGVLTPAGALPANPWLGALALLLGLALVTGGLLSSTLHLGHPERAWRAMSQWRSSWLSREGVAALAVYPPVLLFAIGWVLLGDASGFWAAMGVLGALLSLVTVACTGMIYASLKTIRQWHHPLVLPVYIGLALATGAILLQVLSVLFGYGVSLVAWIAVTAVAGSLALKLLYWASIDRGASSSSPETATGLGRIGKVTQLEAPHSETNYVMSEMGYKVARKHARRVRLLVVLLLFLVPGAASLVVASLGGGVLAGLVALVGLAAAGAGVLAERWLFFAEATHVVTLFYGERAA